MKHLGDVRHPEPPSAGQVGYRPRHLHFLAVRSRSV